MNVQFAGVGESSYLVRRVYVQGVLAQFSSPLYYMGRRWRARPVEDD